MKGTIVNYEYKSWINPALTKPNTWFILRENDLEIEVVIKQGVLYDEKGNPISKHLRDYELKHFEEEIIKRVSYSVSNCD